jgi:hypothetical protein
MTETGLLIAQAVVILLLYLLVWSIVRSSSRELKEADEQVLTTAAAPAATLPAAEAVAPGLPLEPAPETVAAAAAPTETATGARRERPPPALDFSMNIHPRLVVESSPEIEAGTMVELTSGMSIGRGPQNGLALADAFASHMHARIFRRGQFLYIQDLGSTNGTYLNDRRIDSESQLRVHDEIRIGESILRYEE